MNVAYSRVPSSRRSLDCEMARSASFRPTTAAPQRHSSAGRRSSLCFGTVQVMEFPVVLGDNPDVSTGCPVTIDWEPENTMEFQLNRYEYQKARRRSFARNHDELKLSEQERIQMLLDAGFSPSEIARGASAADVVKKHRAATNKQMRWDNFHEVVEVTGRKMKKIVSIPRAGKKSRYQRSLSVTTPRVVPQQSG